MLAKHDRKQIDVVHLAYVCVSFLFTSRRGMKLKEVVKQRHSLVVGDVDKE